MPLQPGDRVERYIIDALLGHGGMGEVYEAHDERLRRRVALKILAATEGEAAGLASERGIRMLREARAAAALEHPNVVAIYDVGEASVPGGLRGTMYIAMELIKGKTLRACIGDPWTSLRTKLRWLTDIARALAVAHASGLVHRDVKPENIMIRDDGVVKVLDFGIAKKASDSSAVRTSSFVVPTTAYGTVRGTPRYMAPEQLRGEVLDGRADQFAWGVVAYEVLTKRLPWSAAAGSVALVSQIVGARPPPFGATDRVPAEIESVVMRALAKDRGARFESMTTLLDALAAAQGSAGDANISSPLSTADAGDNEPTEQLGLEAFPGRRAFALRPAWALATALFLASGVVLLVAAFVIVERRLRERGRGAPVAAAASTSTGCTSNRACSEESAGRAFVCRTSDRACVAVDSEDCRASYEPRDLERDDAVWLGALLPLKGPQAERFGKVNMDGADFARSEVARTMGRLEGAPGRARPIALVECDDSEDAERAARHLVDDVGVPGILGFGSSEELVSLAGSFLIPHRVVSVASLTPDPLTGRIPQPANQARLVWRTTYSYDALATATAAVVHDVLEPRRQASGETRVVLVRSGDVSMGAFAETFYRDLVFNKKPAIDNGHAYQEIIQSSNGEPSRDAIADLIVQGQPSIVVLMITSPLELMNRVESHSRGRPIYLLPDDDSPSFAPFVDESEDRARRVFSIQPLSSATPSGRFATRSNRERHANFARVLDPNTTYDAFYALAYASFSVPPDARVDGVELAGRFAQLVGPGKTVEVGAAGVFDALTALSSGGTINLEGAASSLDFDLKTGETSEDLALFCSDVGARGAKTGEEVESGVVYRSKLHHLEGTVRCR